MGEGLEGRPRQSRIFRIASGGASRHRDGGLRRRGQVRTRLGSLRRGLSLGGAIYRAQRLGDPGARPLVPVGDLRMRVVTEALLEEGDAGRIGKQGQPCEAAGVAGRLRGADREFPNPVCVPPRFLPRKLDS